MRAAFRPGSTWTPASAAAASRSTILTHCREALPSGGRVLIVEPVLPEGVGADAGARGGDEVTYSLIEAVAG
ncbi:hypothetical protein [Streptomyces sp. NPDC001828]|uniref:hypothetical protein n=1 Tax=Streptomyces sp. NPDC001828 TaxID=3364615 RepID=UPI00367AD6CA